MVLVEKHLISKIVLPFTLFDSLNCAYLDQVAFINEYNINIQGFR